MMLNLVRHSHDHSVINPKMEQNWIKNRYKNEVKIGRRPRWKINQKSTQKPSKIDQKSTKNEPKISLGGVSGGPWGLLAAKIEKTRKKSQLLGPLGAILGPSWGPLGAVLALGSPSWAVLGRLGAIWSRLKIDVKIDQKINAFQDRFLKRFWWILGGKMEASWHQNQLKIDACCEMRFFEKTLFFFRKNYYFQGSGGPSWEQKSIKNRSENEVKIGKAS